MNENEEMKEAGTAGEAGRRKGLFRTRNLLVTGGVVGLIGIAAVGGAIAATDKDEGYGGKDDYAEKSWSVGYGGEEPEEGEMSLRNAPPQVLRAAEVAVAEFGGKAVEVEQEGTEGWEVELIGPGGSELEVWVDGKFKVVGSEVEEEDSKDSEDSEYGSAGMDSASGGKATTPGPAGGMGR
jgi:hypothetical protein